MNRLLLIFLLFSLTGCASLLPPPIARFELQAPRPFGYVIGDLIHHRVLIETRRDMALNLASVPVQGELNRWLHLNDVKIVSDRDSGETAIDLTYQVFYAPNEVKMLTVPGFKLQFTQAGKTVEQSVPPWHFTLSPLKELAVRKDQDGRHYMRPDAEPAPLPNAGAWLALYACLGVAAALGLYLTYLYGYFPLWPKRRIFKQALCQLEKLPDDALERGLAVIHHALNAVNGQPLFKHQLPAFYQNHPEYRAAAADLERFFDYSNRVLFGGRIADGGEVWQPLLGLAKLCREIERGSR